MFHSVVYFVILDLMPIDYSMQLTDHSFLILSQLVHVYSPCHNLGEISINLVELV